MGGRSFPKYTGKDGDQGLPGQERLVHKNSRSQAPSPGLVVSDRPQKRVPFVVAKVASLELSTFNLQVQVSATLSATARN